jgi:hypothetical protein
MQTSSIELLLIRQKYSLQTLSNKCQFPSKINSSELQKDPSYQQLDYISLSEMYMLRVQWVRKNMYNNDSTHQ